MSRCDRSRAYAALKFQGQNFRDRILNFAESELGIMSPELRGIMSPELCPPNSQNLLRGRGRLVPETALLISLTQPDISHG